MSRRRNVGRIAWGGSDDRVCDPASPTLALNLRREYDHLGNAPEATATITPVSLEGGELFSLQLRVARRADVLAQRLRAPRELDRCVWLRAELEVFERAETAHPWAMRSASPL